jgi:hypothetical protein
MRNVGAKNIALVDVKAENFKLSDAKSSEMRVSLWAVPETMAYGHAAVAYLHTWDASGHPSPWKLSFDSPQSGGLVELQLEITGINPATRGASGK